MKRIHFFPLFILIQIGIIFLLIYRQSTLIGLSYQKQKNELLLSQLAEQHKEFIHTFEKIKNPLAIKEYARQKLGMVPVRLSHIKKVSP